MKIYASGILILIITTLIISCSEPAANIKNPRTFDDGVVSFKYPGNWEISDQLTKSDYRHIFVESPGDVLVIIQIYYSEDQFSIEKYAESFALRASKKMPFGSIGDSTFADVEKVDGYEVLQEDFSAKLLGQDIPHKRIYRYKKNGNKAGFIVCQIAREDLGRVEEGFDLIASSCIF